MGRTWLACLLLASCVEAGADTEAKTSPSASPPAPAKTAAPAPSVEPKPPSVREVIAAIPEDPPPPKIIRMTHYFVSNEYKPELFRPIAEGLRGIYVGVGAEQNYLFAGWARPEVLLLVDFDQWVVDVHTIHGVFMADAKHPEAFIANWSTDKEDHAKKLLTAALPDAEARERVLEMYRITRPGVYARLSTLRIGFRARSIPTVLNDRAQYDHIAGLFRKGHARALRGDFTGKRTMAGIAKAAREIKKPVRAIYLSNVEDYFDYDSGLGANLLAQPSDKRSLLLRTIPIDDVDYVYVSQRMGDFRRWLDGGAVNRAAILASSTITKGPKGMYLPGP